MTVTTNSPRAVRPPRRPRGEGQWAVGHREPLNANERTKKDDDPLNVRQRIEQIYARQGFRSIDPQDLRGRFRWYGLYTQRKPGIDGGRTATLEPEELEDEYFMLRIRIDGGQLDLSQLRTIADISQEFGRDTADVTDRQNIQLHWVRIEDVPEIWRRLEGVGLSTTEACGDCPRVVIGSAVAGISADEVIDATPAIRQIVQRYVGSPEFSNLPRKYKTSISWLPDVPYEANDVAFLGVVHPEHGPGFDLWVGGGLSTNPMLAKRLGVWVPLEEVPEVWAGSTAIFRDYGYRRLRHRARLKFLVADWGVEKFRQVLEDEYLHRRLIDGPPPRLPARPIDHLGVHPQRDGRHYVGVSPIAGRVSGTLLHQLADAARAPRLRPGAPHPVPEDPRAGRGRGADRATGVGAGPDRTAGESVADPAGSDGLHWHRVLQARDRGDQGARGHPGGAAGTDTRRTGRRHYHQHQWMPERLRPHPGRRHRPEGTDRAGSRRTPGGGLPDPSGRRAGTGRGRRVQLRAQGAWTEDHRRGASGVRGARRRRYLAGRKEDESFSAWVMRADEEELR